MFGTFLNSQRLPFHSGVRSRTLSIPFRSFNAPRNGGNTFQVALSASDSSYLSNVRILGVQSYRKDVLPCDPFGNENVPNGVFERTSMTLSRENVQWARDIDLPSIRLSNTGVPNNILLLGGGYIDPSSSFLEYYPTNGYDFSAVLPVPDTANFVNSENFILTIWYVNPYLYQRLNEVQKLEKELLDYLSLANIQYSTVSIPVRDGVNRMREKSRFNQVDTLSRQWIVSIEALNPLVSPNGRRGEVNVNNEIYKRAFLTLSNQSVEFIGDLPLINCGSVSDQSGKTPLYLGGSFVNFSESFVTCRPPSTFAFPDVPVSPEAFQFRVGHIDPRLVDKYQSKINNIHRQLKDLSNV